MNKNEEIRHQSDSRDNFPDVQKIPRDLPILPLRNLVVYPFTLVPLAVGIKRSKKLVEDATQGNRLICLTLL